MKQHFAACQTGLSKRLFKRAFAVVFTLCMLVALAPKNSLPARAEGEAAPKNLALSAKVSTNVEQDTWTESWNLLTRLIDGNRGTHIWRQGEPASTAEKDYYQLNWDEPVSANAIVLAVIQARNQAPTAWRVQVSKDGTNDWTDVVSVTDVEWKELGDIQETKKLTFTPQQDIKGIRVCIENAHLAYGGYAINELEVYNDPAVKATNYALTARVSASATLDGENSPANLHDGDTATEIWRAGTAADIEGKDYYQFDWENPVSVNQVVLVSRQGLATCPTAWRVQVLKDGADDWVEVASISDVEWEYGANDDNTLLEEKELSFELQENVIGLRLWIDKANLTWGGYTLKEIEIYNDPDTPSGPPSEPSVPEEPENGNYALIAEVSTNVGQDIWTEPWNPLANLHDGDTATEIWRAGTAADIEGKDYYQFDWGNPVSVNQVVLVFRQGLATCPTAWRVQVLKDGADDWVEVASISDVEWEYGANDDNTLLEEKELSFELQENVIGLRLWIDKANLTWGGYTLKEIEIYNSTNNPETGDTTPVVPAMLAVLISATGVVACMCGYRKNRKHFGKG